MTEEETFPAIPPAALVPVDPNEEVGHALAPELAASRAAGDPTPLLDALAKRTGVPSVVPAFRAYAAATLNASRIAGGMHLRGIGPATRELGRAQDFFGAFGDETLPGLRVGDNRGDVPLWLCPGTDAVLSLHEEETLDREARRAAEMNRHSVAAAWYSLARAGSAMTIPMLVRLQVALFEAFGDRLPPVDGQYLKIVLAALGMRRDVFQRRLDRFAFEVFRLHEDDVARLATEKPRKTKTKTKAVAAPSDTPVWKGEVAPAGGETPLPALWQLKVPTSVAALCAWRGGTAIAVGGDVVAIDGAGGVRWRVVADRLNAGTHGIRAAGEMLVTHVRPQRGGPEELVVLGDGEVRRRVRLDHVIDHPGAWVVVGSVVYALGRTKKGTHRWSRVDLATGERTGGDLERRADRIALAGDRFLAMSRFAPGLSWMDRDGRPGDVVVEDPVWHLAHEGDWVAVTSGASHQGPLTVRALPLPGARERWTAPAAIMVCDVGGGRLVLGAGDAETPHPVVRDLGSGDVVYEGPRMSRSWPLALRGNLLLACAEDERDRASLFDLSRRERIATLDALTKVDVIGDRIYLREMTRLICAALP